MKVAIAFNTKDRVELSSRTIDPLLQPDKFDLFWFDGSETTVGRSQQWGYTDVHIFTNVIGGPGVGMIHALAQMLNESACYTHVGLCEADTLLPADWFEPTMALFGYGARDGLKVGAVSARCYADRILTQQDGYALCHNLGAGHIVFTRQAAEIVLNTFRSAWTVDNRRVFERLSGIDIGRYWAFGQSAHFLTADWHWETALACHGLAALALTPSFVEMIGQEPPLDQQGLSIIERPVEALRNDEAFGRFAFNSERIRNGLCDLGIDPVFQRDVDSGAHTYFAHQLAALGGVYCGNWDIRDLRRIGPLTWVSADPGAELMLNLSGACSLLVSGGDKGAKCRVEDDTGFSVEPLLDSEPSQGVMLAVNLPGHGMTTRSVKLTALDRGVRFYGVQSRESQVFDPQWRFDGADVVRMKEPAE